MGAASLCLCSEEEGRHGIHRPKKTEELEPPAENLVLQVEKCLAEPKRLKPLQGPWYRKDGTKMGDIIEDFFLWDSRLKAQSVSTLNWSNDLLDMDIDGMKYEAVVSLHAQATLSWCDGDVWVLK
ncbi:unnamed protein product [Durusdinium trenchii]|uniref:Uncharacterized protein n=1 Tax=Durusdinium trenchii TaxID=1381693 RepID=A0ABP0NN08_9DINO